MFNSEEQTQSENNYKSKYYNIDAYYESTAKKEGWQKEDFIWALKVLESLPKEKLIEICEDPQIQLRFIDIDKNKPEDWDKIDEEQIVSALISDYGPDTLLPILKKFTQ